MFDGDGHLSPRLIPSCSQSRLGSVSCIFEVIVVICHGIGVLRIGGALQIRVTRCSSAL